MINESAEAGKTFMYFTGRVAVEQDKDDNVVIGVLLMTKSQLYPLNS